MILKYLNHSWRLLVRNPFFTLINLVSLSVGFAVFIVLWPYAQSELKSDQFHPDSDRIIRVARSMDVVREGVPFHVDLPTNLCGPVRQVASEFSEVSDFTRVVMQSDFEHPKTFGDKDVFFSVYIDADRHNFREDKAAIADSNFFQFFGFPLLSGDPKTVLAKANTLAVSETIAQKYFGDSN